MSVIYLEHPRHGTKVAIAEPEAAADEKNGWKRMNPVSPSPNPLAAIEPPVEAKRPPGRPRRSA